MKVNFILFITIVLIGMLSACSKDKILYKDASQPVEVRVDDLLKRMTLEEKVGQMCQWVGLEHMKSAERDLTEMQLRNNTARGFYPGITVEDVEQMVRDSKIGSFFHVLTLEESNALQRLAMESRLQIDSVQP